MEIDWIVGVAIFLIFITWAFTFYVQIFETEEADVSETLNLISSKVMDNLTVDVKSIPVKFTSGEADSDTVLWFEFRWPFGKNTTRVYKDGTSQTCNITGNKLYWQSSVSSGDNFFNVKFSEQNSSLFCTGGFSVVNETQVIPFSAETVAEISLERINYLKSIDYSDFKTHLGISRDFNITIKNDTGTVLSYGLIPPRRSDVFSESILRDLEETGGNLTIRILTW